MEHIPLKRLRLNPDNPRRIRDDGFEALMRSLAKFPKMLWVRGLAVNADPASEEVLMTLGGNQRLLGIRKFVQMPEHELIERVGDKPQNLAIWQEVRTRKAVPEGWVVDASFFTPEEMREFIVRDNVEFGEHDFEALANEYEKEELDDWGVFVPGFEDESEAEASEDGYEMPDKIETDIVLGDLFEIGPHRLLCGDSTDSDAVARLMNGEKADMVFTDPPYGMAYESNAWDSTKSKVIQKRTDTQILNDDNTNVGQDALNLIPLFLNNNRHFYIWCRWDCFHDFKQVCESIGKIKSVVVWDKGGPGLGDLKGSYGDSEWAIFGMIGRRELKERQNGVWQVNRMKGLQMQHPTQKPLEICERGINNSTNVNELILDLFLGSGSTMVAAHQLNRKCYGMELSPVYCQVIIDRMQRLDPEIVIKKNGEHYAVTSDKQR